MLKHREDLLPPLRIGLLVVVTVLIGVAQNIFLMELPVPIILSIPLTAAIAIREKELTSLLFGMLSGAILDLVSPIHDGVFTLTFALLAMLVSLLARYKVRDTLAGAVVLTLFFTAVVYGVLYVFLLARLKSLSDAALRLFFPAMVVSAVLTPVFYYPIRFAEEKLRR